MATTSTDASLPPGAAAFRLGQEAVLAAILALALLVLAFTSEQFFTVDNLLNQGRLACEVGLVALPMTCIIVTGGIDLSVGSILGLCAIMLGVLWKNMGLPLELAIALTLVIGTLAGHGQRPGHHPDRRAAADRHAGDAGPLSRPRRGHQPGALGARLSRTGSSPWASARSWRHPDPALVAGACHRRCSACVLARTTFGRTLYAIGNNETASRFSGLPVDRAKLIIYGLSGLMSGLAAWIFVSRVSTTRSDMGTGLELDVIAAVVLGGTSIFGGTGSILGTVLGVVLVQLLKNGLALTGVKGDATIVVIGTVLILSILLTNWPSAAAASTARSGRHQPLAGTSSRMGAPASHASISSTASPK